MGLAKTSGVEGEAPFESRKAVAQAIPTYMMSCFKLPVAICEAINKMVSNFWWGQQGSERKIHWLKWGRLCKGKGYGGVGFREMEAFNLALLAKQGWRLMHGANSLFYKVYKVKYFPYESFMEAKLGSCLSFTWRSTMTTRPVLEAGSRWRIGCGETVQVWGSRWLPNPSTFKVVSPCVASLENMLVSDLIDSSGMRWKKELISSLLLPIDVADICKIPLSIHAAPDCVVWHFSKHGVFSVRSAYPVAVDILKKRNSFEESECSNREIMDKLWKTLWSLSIPNKIKIFLWRAIVDILPTGTKLAQRHIPVDFRCKLCGDQAETPVHLFTQCAWVRIVWENFVFHLPKDKCFLDFCQLFEFLCSSLDMAEVEVCCIMLWLVWGHRNAIVHSGRGRFPVGVFSDALQYLKEFQDAQHKMGVVPLRPVGVGSASWMPPVDGVYKLNIDGSWLPGENTGGVGGVIRDWKGEVIGGFAKPLIQCVSADHAKAMAILHGILFARDIGIQKLVVEGDCLGVISAIRCASKDLSDLGHILDDIKDCLACFCSWEVAHVRRSANGVAHALAGFGRSGSSDKLRLEELPSCFQEALNFDYSSVGA
uniref:Reverse transcriptase zinc-binding domain-containing protein n=1 Tax=Davidia involucrata TaxID=16924 RepID=A0A5B7A5C8_DAVIN